MISQSLLNPLRMLAAIVLYLGLASFLPAAELKPIPGKKLRNLLLQP